MPTPIFEVQALTKVYHTGEVDIRALSEVDLPLYESELAVLLGPSGSGRSSPRNNGAARAPPHVFVRALAAAAGK